MVIVIYKILFHILHTGQTFTPEVLLFGLIRFVIVALGSSLIGLALGVLTSLATLATTHVRGMWDDASGLTRPRS